MGRVASAAAQTVGLAPALAPDIQAGQEGFETVSRGMRI